MILKFKGKVGIGDDCRVGECDKPDGAILIGDRDLIGEVFAAKWSGPVVVGIADERFSGPIAIEEGWGYSEYTPMESDSLTVGAHDIIDILEKYIDQEITVWIADEPVNLLD